MQQIIGKRTNITSLEPVAIKPKSEYVYFGDYSEYKGINVYFLFYVSLTSSLHGTPSTQLGWRMVPTAL